MTTIPTPTIATPHSYHDPGRNREIFYPVFEKDGKTHGVLIGIGHSKGSKAFHAVANDVTRSTDGPFTVTTYASIWEGVRLPGQPVARYSAKALDAYTAQIAEDFAHYVTVSPKMQDWFAQTPETAEQV